MSSMTRADKRRRKRERLRAERRQANVDAWQRNRASALGAWRNREGEDGPYRRAVASMTCWQNHQWMRAGMPRDRVAEFAKMRMGAS